MNTDHLLSVAEKDNDFAFKCKVIALSLARSLNERYLTGREREVAEDLFETFVPFFDPTYKPDEVELFMRALQDFTGAFDARRLATDTEAAEAIWGSEVNDAEFNDAGKVTVPFVFEVVFSAEYGDTEV